MPLKRSTTIVNGQDRGPGQSQIEGERDRYNQRDVIRNPHKNFEDHYKFEQQKTDLYNQWDSKRNSTVDEKRDFDEFYANNYNPNYKRSSRRRRRSLSKSSRKYKKSKRVFRKKSRATRRR